MIKMHVAKYKGNQCGQLLAHNNRGKDKKGEREFSNTNIDHERTKLNYNLAPQREERDIDYLNQRVDEIKHMNRADVVRMCSVAITLPQGCEHSRDFFECAYNALSDRYGGEHNVVSSYVHMDERTPHMHFNFVPVSTRDGQERLCAKDVITRADLTTLHKDIEREINRQLRERGREPVRLENGRTKDQERNLSAHEYKQKQEERERREDRQHVEPQRKLFGRDYKAAYEQECREHERTREELRSERAERERDHYAALDRQDRLQRDLRAENAARCELLDRWNDPRECREHARELERERNYERDRER